MLMLHVHDTQNKTEDPSNAMHIAQGYAQDQLENQLKEVVKRRGSPFLFGLRNIPRKIYRTNIMHKTIINASTGHFDLLHFAFFTFWHFHTLTLTQINPFILQYVNKGQARHSTNPILVFNSLSCQAGTLTSDKLVVDEKPRPNVEMFWKS